MPEYIVDQNGNPLGSLANYAYTKSGVPLDPRDTSGQVPAFSATVADMTVSARVLAGGTVTLSDWAGDQTAAQVIQTQSAGRHVRRMSNPLTNNPMQNRHPGVGQVDGVTVLGNLNTKQTVFPMAGSGGNAVGVQHVIQHWCMTCGVTPLRMPGNLLHYVDGSDPGNYLGYAATQTYPWVLQSRSQSYAKTSNLTFQNADPVKGPYPALGVTAAASGLFGGIFPLGATAGIIEADFNISVNGFSTLILQIQKDASGTWTVYEKTQAKGSTTYKTNTAMATGSYTPSGDVFASVLVQGDANDTTKASFTLRLIDKANGTIKDFASSGTLTSYTRQNPIPTQISLQALAGATSRPTIAYISEGSSLPAAYPVTQISFGSGVTGSSPLTAAPGFTDNVWSKLREFCSIYDIDMDISGTAISFKDRSTVTADANGKFIPALALHTTSPSQTTKALTGARRVEVAYSKLSKTTGDSYNNKLIWKATSVINLAQGEQHVETVKGDTSFISLQNPTPVSAEPVPYNLAYGSYTVWGNDGYVVDPKWWTNNGGYVKVEPTGNSGEFKLTIQAPNVSTTRAPYKISEGTDNPALYIFGDGIPTTQTKMQSFTGNPYAAQDIGVTFSAPYIVDDVTARNAAMKLASYFAGADTEISFTVPRPDLLISQNADSSPAVPDTYMAIPLGSNIKWDGSYFRIQELSIGPSGYNVTKAVTNNSIAVINGEFVNDGNVNFWNSFYGNSLISEVSIAPIPDDYVPTAALYPADTTYPSDTLFPSGG